MELIGYIASVFIGLVLGLLGGGGSILSIPILVYLFHIEPVRASAYSLFIVGVTSFAGAIPKYREHLVNLRTGILFGIPSIAVIFCTRKWVVPAIPEIVFSSENFVVTKRLLVLGLFAILMIIAAFPMIRDKKELRASHPRFRTFLVIVEEAKRSRRFGVHNRRTRLYRRQALASDPAAVGQGGLSALGRITVQEAVLPFATDFRRLILSFHVSVSV